MSYILMTLSVLGGLLVYLVIGYYIGAVSLAVWNRVYKPSSGEVTGTRKIICFLLWPMSVYYYEDQGPFIEDADERVYLLTVLFLWPLKLVWNTIAYVLILAEYLLFVRLFLPLFMAIKKKDILSIISVPEWTQNQK